MTLITPTTVIQTTLTKRGVWQRMIIETEHINFSFTWGLN